MHSAQHGHNMPPSSTSLTTSSTAHVWHFPLQRRNGGTGLHELPLVVNEAGGQAGGYHQVCFMWRANAMLQSSQNIL